MLTMIYKPGGKAKVWGTTAHVKVIDSADIESHLADGWLDHPSKLFAEPEDKPKRGRKTKAATDEPDDKE